MTSIIIITILELLLVAIACYITYRICDKKAPRFDSDRKCDKCGTFMRTIWEFDYVEKPEAIGHQCNNEDCDSYEK